MFTTLKPLPGHVSVETAYVVNDYPYSFHLRCRIRYHLEFRSGKGFRLVSQTLNPKITTHEHWNAPKKSTYSSLAVMGLDEKGHCTWTGFSLYDLSKLEEFGKLYAESFDDNQKKVYEDLLKIKKVYDTRQAKAEAEKSKEVSSQ